MNVSVQRFGFSFELGNLAGFLAVLLWSTVPLAVVHCGELPIWQLIGIANFGTFLMVLFGWFIKGEDIGKKFRTPLRFIAVAVLGTAVFRGLFWSAVLMADPLEATVLGCVWGILSVVFGAVVAGIGFSKKDFGGLALGSAGIGLILLFPAKGLETGHILAVVSGLVWGFYVALVRKDFRFGGEAAAIGYLLGGFAFVGISMMVGENWDVELVSLVPVGVVVVLGTLGTVLWEMGMKHGDQRALGIWGRCMPLLMVLWLVAAGKGIITVVSVIALAMIVSGSVVVTGRAQK